ncbi:sigma 54-interacting transcriptional regulator [Roseibium salinum]|nr:sigma 54-interacting transcriptional regulator [Roseibium salinum]
MEAASGGVLFLDEIVSMPLGLQPKLLRVLQEKQVDRIGGTRPVDVDIRLVSAANMDPKEAVVAGRLREDLLFRLNTIELMVPPLRERGRDSLLLFDTFLNRFAAQYGQDVPAPSARDEAFLQTYSWPGNVRELRNAAERFVLNAGVGPQPLEALVTGRRDTGPIPAEGGLKELMDAYERNLIEGALRRHGGRMADVMSELNLPRRTLNEKDGPPGPQSRAVRRCGSRRNVMPSAEFRRKLPGIGKILPSCIAALDRQARQKALFFAWRSVVKPDWHGSC